MQKTISRLPADEAGLLDLGAVLGQNQAFGAVAGRCSSARAEGIRRLREERTYKRCTPHWQDFCPRYLKMSRSQADEIIALWEEFGAGYFELAQLTRISAETYRAILPAVKDGALHFNGEELELNPNNAQKVAAAVTELRRTVKKPARQIEMHERIAELDSRCKGIVAELAEIAVKERHGENWLLFAGVLSRHFDALERLGRANGVL